MALLRNLPHVLSALILLAAMTPAVAQNAEKPLRNIQALATTFTGHTTRGETVIGYAWFTRGSRRGDFCMRLDADATCAGTYPARVPDLDIAVPFRCSNGRRGTATVHRRLRREHRLIVAQSGSLAFEDGATGTISFGETVPYDGRQCNPAEAGS